MDAQDLQPIAILGAGSWGTALAMYLSRRQQTVRLWSIDPTEISAMLADGANERYLPGHRLPPTLLPTADLAEALAGMTEVLLAVPSVGFRSTLVLMKPLLSSHAKLICATKGLEDGTGRLCHEMANEVLGGQYSFAALSGPSFAKEVAAGLPTAVAIASTDAGWIKVIAARFRSAIFQTHACEDVTGVEIAAVVKNVIAIATGMSDGMKLGANARSALITFGLNEMTCLGLAIGAKKDTFMGLAGVGDLILTCSDDQSRNRRLGLALGHGKSIADAEKEIGQVVEGKRNAEIVVKLASEHQVSMPTCSLVWDILQGKVMLQDVKERFLQTTG